jgi:SAM-dependent methyltransferase
LPTVVVTSFRSEADWKAGVHTPRLASVQFITAEKVVKPVFESGYGPQQYNKFPLKRRYLGACPEVLHFIKDGTLEIVLASLVLHYIKNIENVFFEINRILKIDGELIFSIHHPLMEFVHFKRENYMEIELLEDEWTMGEEKIEVQFYRRPLNKMLQPLIDAGFYIEKVLEPEPAKEFKEKLPEAYERLLKRPNFFL